MERIIKAEEEFIPAAGRNSKNAGEINTAALNSIVLYLTFLLGNDIFGIQVGEIREVIDYKKVFKVPGVPECIRGVINLRGEVVPVIDLHSRFYSTTSSINNSTSIVVVELNDENQKIPIGIIIDSVQAVTELFEDSIETVPEIGNRIRPDFIHGIGKVEDQFVLLLNIPSILDLAELSDIDGRIRKTGGKDV